MTDREGNYTYDPKSRRFRAPDGRYVSAAEVVGLRDHIIAAKSARTVSLVNSLYAGTISPSAFVLSMRDEIKRTVLMEYMLGRGGLNAMTSADYGRIGSILKPQYQYLNTFVTQVMEGNVTKDQAIRRAGMYIDSTRVAHERAKGVAWDVNLPAYPGIHPNCACDWDIQRKGDAIHAYWKTRGGKSCVECENNESTWNPLVFEGPDA